MTPEKDLLSHFASVLPVTNIFTSVNYYQNELGFKLTYTWNEPMEYAVMERGGVHIHLSSYVQSPTQPGTNATLYVFVHDIDALYEEFRSKDVNITQIIGDRVYGMRDFDVKDPDGYILTFGKG